MSLMRVTRGHLTNLGREGRQSGSDTQSEPRDISQSSDRDPPASGHQGWQRGNKSPARHT